MGQTLSHGVYLPNEGERNCYAGLASNWQILNTAVGAIAEKAPLVHTHGNITNDGKVGTTANLPLITGTGGAVQAGSFGNTANTFCEGNDSRLSDARTPVAHTHTKSDVTDLLNSDFIPSANNAYDLGSSSYQWNKVYSADVVHTTGDENIVGIKSFIDNIKMKSNVIDNTVTPTTNKFKNLYITDKNNVNLGTLYYVQRTNNNRELNLQVYNPNDSEPLNFNLVHTGDTRNAVFQGDNFVPNLTNSNLGNSYNKWKSLNGINPGALSLPTLNYTDTSKYMDISGGLTTTGSNQWYTPAVDGWVFIIVNNSPTFANILVFVTPNGTNPAKFIAGSGGVIESSSNAMWCGCPAPAGSRVRIRIKDGTIEQAVFVTCQGNV